MEKAIKVQRNSSRRSFPLYFCLMKLTPFEVVLKYPLSISYRDRCRAKTFKNPEVNTYDLLIIIITYEG